MNLHFAIREIRVVILTGVVYTLFSAMQTHGQSTPSKMSRLRGHVPQMQIAQARHLGRLNSETKMSLAVPLKLTRQADLEALIQRIHNPADPLYGKYLTPQEFAQQFAPSAAEIAQVTAELEAGGLKVTETHLNQMMILAEGRTADVERTLQVELHEYIAKDGRRVFAASSDPVISSVSAGKIVGVLGLESFTRRAPRIRRRASASAIKSDASVGSKQGLLTKDIRGAYSFNSTLTGSGQAVALVELDGFTASDLSGWASTNSLSQPNVKTVLTSGFSGTPTPLSDSTSGAPEVTLDIEMVMSLAPGLSQIYVYEAPPTATDAQWLLLLSKIASDNLASVVSCSWGSAEDQTASATMQSENNILIEMAAQGQTFFAASGDTGAYADGTTLGVQDPSAQPYAVAVGATTLTLSSSGGYQSESSWGQAATKQQAASGGGGGVSTQWPLPSYQLGVSSAVNQASSTMRNVPDVALNANPNTGYAIYLGGALAGPYGGTSAAAPLWAAMTAIINQMRFAQGLTSIGQLHIPLYTLGQSSLYGSLFFDVKDASSNLYYTTVAGYDLSTGWGSFNAAALMPVLAGKNLPPAPPTGLKFTSVSSGGN